MKISVFEENNSKWLELDVSILGNSISNAAHGDAILLEHETGKGDLSDPIKAEEREVWEYSSLNGYYRHKRKLSSHFMDNEEGVLWTGSIWIIELLCGGECRFPLCLTPWLWRRTGVWNQISRYYNVGSGWKCVLSYSLWSLSVGGPCRKVIGLIMWTLEAVRNLHAFTGNLNEVFQLAGSHFYHNLFAYIYLSRTSISPVSVNSWSGEILPLCSCYKYNIFFNSFISNQNYSDSIS
jgi:hypothetical protein